MRRRLSLIIALLMVCTLSWGQAETTASKSTAARFLETFNAQNSEALFALFDPGMQAALPLGKTRELIASLHAQQGPISTMEFIEYVTPYALYKTTFRNGILTVRISTDADTLINGLFLAPYTPKVANTNTQRNKTPMTLPFKGAWYVFWGGDTPEQNYHRSVEAQKGAFDFICRDTLGQSHRGSGTRNEDYYAYGKDILSPCVGQVVLSVDGVKDNVPGVVNPMHALGNCVIIRTPNDEYVVLAHFRQNSVRVREGQKVRPGQLLGECGNSGNSTEAHLHFDIQSAEDFNTAVGIKCHFEALKVGDELRSDYSPVRGDIIETVTH